MAVAEIIGAAIGVMLLVIVAYMLVGSVLTTAEIVSTAQKDLTMLQEAQLRTSINVNKSTIETSIVGNGLNFSVTNTGNVIISDFEHMDIFTWDGSESEFQHYTYSTSCGSDNTWCKIIIVPDTIHPNQLDPGEKMWVWATFSGNNPIWFQITTSNGVNAQTTYP